MFPSADAFGGWSGLLGDAPVGVAPARRLSQLVLGTQRYPDTYTHDYAAFVRDPESGGQLPPLLAPDKLPNPPSVVLVGGGLGNLVAAYELARCGFLPLVLEADEKNMGGRLRSVLTGQLAEMGARTIPTDSKLFWHYLKVAMYPTSDPTLYTATSPGTVPTDIIWQGLRSTVDVNNLYDRPRELRLVEEKWIFLLKSIRSSTGVSISDVQYLLSKPGLAPLDESLIEEFWLEMLRRYDGKSLRTVVRTEGDAFTDEDLYVFETVGFGFGGFGAHLDASFVEMLRLVLWNFDATYELPTDASMWMFTLQLEYAVWMEVLKRYPHVSRQDIFKRGATVLNVSACDRDVLVSYTLDGSHREETFDYALVGMTNRAMQDIGLADNNQHLGPDRLQMYYAPFNSPYSYGTEGEAGHAVASSVRAGIRGQSMASASVTYQYLTDPRDDSAWPKGVQDRTVMCTVSDTMAGVSSWGLKSSGLALTTFTLGSASTKLAADTHLGRLETIAEQYLSPYYANATPVHEYQHVSRCIAGGMTAHTIDWQDEPMFRGGVKLDGVGGYYGTASLAWHYLVAETTYPAEGDELPPYRRVFLTGEAASFLGGWVEGAAMSALNAVTAVLYQCVPPAQKGAVRTSALLAPPPPDRFRNVSMGHYFAPSEVGPGRTDEK